MRLLILSDSHGKSDILEEIIRKEKEATHIFFLGDLVRDIEDLVFLFPEKTFHIVSGNCDYFATQKSVDTVKLGGKKILFTHGHNFNVKKGSTEYLESHARQNKCDIALYGHTHIPDIDIRGGVFLINPGSVGHSRSGPETYAVIDILDGKIIPTTIKI